MSAAAARPGGGLRGALGRLSALSVKELLQLRRDRLTLAMMVGLPAVQLLLFGYAIDTDVRHVPAVVLDQDRSAASRDFVVRLRSTGFYDVRGEVRSYDEIGRALRAGEAKAALIFPARWGADAAAGRAAALQLVVDGSDPQTVGSAIDSATGLAFARTSDLLLERMGRAGVPVPAAAISVEPVTWYNPDLKTSTFVVPGLVGVILTMTMVMLTAMAVARERERGTLEQLIVSPLKPAELIIGKIVPYVGIGYVQMTLVLVLGKLAFGVPFVGSIGMLYAIAALFIAANLALGLVFSTIARTQQQAMQMSFFFLLPNILLSGFAFPWEGMPKAAQALSLALPLTHFLRIVRGVILKGSGLHDFAGELIWLGGILAALVLMASLRFNKKLA